MKALLSIAASAAFLTGCYTDDNQGYRSGDVMIDPAGAEVPGETWSEDPRDLNQKPYKHQFETERHQQYESDPDFTHDRLD